MTKKLITYFLGLLIMGYLSYQFPLFSFVSLALFGIVLLYILIVGVVKFFKKRLKGKWIQAPTSIAIILLSAMAISLLRPLPTPIKESGNIQDDLAYAYQMDQADRMNMKFFLGVFQGGMIRRDSLRLEQVRHFQRTNAIKKPMEKYHAAFILHHNPQRDSVLYRQAFNMADEAASDPELSDDFQVQWLAKATYDRYMLSIGKDEKYNTQGGISLDIK